MESWNLQVRIELPGKQMEEDIRCVSFIFGVLKAENFLHFSFKEKERESSA